MDGTSEMTTYINFFGPKLEKERDRDPEEDEHDFEASMTKWGFGTP